MKSIETFEVKERRLKKRRMILGIVLVVLMVGSTLGYAFSLFIGSNSDKIEIDRGLAYQNGFWTFTRDDGSILLFSSSLEDTKNTEVDVDVFLDNYYRQPVFIVANDSLVELEISRVIGVVASRMQKACYGPCGEELPEKNCADNLIIYRKNELNKVYQEGKCVFIEGDIKSADAFLYYISEIN